jgi:phosphoglycolate phosphatase
MVHRCLADNGLEDAFDLVIGRVSDGGETKAQTIARALDALGAKPSQAVMVGDRYFDVDGARANDVPCVGVTYGHTAPRSELEQAGAVAIAGSVDELRRILLG